MVRQDTVLPTLEESQNDKELVSAVHISNTLLHVPSYQVGPFLWKSVIRYFANNQQQQIPSIIWNKSDKVRSELKKFIVYLRGGVEKAVHEDCLQGIDMRAWELFVLLVGGVPTNSPPDMNETIKCFRDQGILCSGNAALNKLLILHMIESANREYQRKSRPFEHLCIFSVLWSIMRSKRISETKTVILSQAHLKLIVTWVRLLFDEWEGFMERFDLAIAPYTYFNLKTLKMTQTPRGRFSYAQCKRSICQEDPYTHEIEKTGYDLGDTAQKAHRVFRRIAEEFIKSLYLIENVYKSTPIIPPSLHTVIQGLRSSLLASRIGMVVDGHLCLEEEQFLVQRFPRHMLRALKQKCRLEKSPAELAAIELENWSDADQKLIQDFDMRRNFEDLLNVDAACQDVYVARSNIPIEMDGLFADKHFKDKEVIARYWGLIVKYDVAQRNEMRSDDTWGPDVFLSTKRQFIEYGIDVSPDTAKKTVFLVASPSCAAGKANHERKFDTHGKPMQSQGYGPVNAELVIHVDQDYASSCLVTVSAKGAISQGDEILLDYGADYQIDSRK